MDQASWSFLEWEKAWYPKFIVTGEHSVLRGSPAVVFPYKQKSLKAGARLWIKIDSEVLAKREKPNQTDISKIREDQNRDHVIRADDERVYALPLQDDISLFRQQFVVNSQGENAQDIPLLVQGLWQESLRRLGISSHQVVGNLSITNEVPLGAGLGGSALFCTLVSQLLVQLKLLPEEEGFRFAWDLENHFHGQSSGVDVAGVFAGKPAVYSIPQGLSLIDVKTQVQFSLHHSGQKGITRQAVEQVLGLKDKDPELFQQGEELMRASAHAAIQALEAGNEEQLVAAIEKGRQAFETWDLVTPAMQKVMQELLSQGALAVKPTGSGLGGFILAVWSPETCSQQAFERSLAWHPRVS